jgi:hypothetical protein
LLCGQITQELDPTETRIDGVVFGSVSRLFPVKRFAYKWKFINLTIPFVFEGVAVVQNMPLINALDPRVRWIFISKARIGDEEITFNDCWLGFVYAGELIILHPLGGRPTLKPYKIYDGWAVRLPRQDVRIVVYLASSRRIAEDIGRRILYNVARSTDFKKLLVMPVSCYKCPEELMKAEPPK